MHMTMMTFGKTRRLLLWTIPILFLLIVGCLSPQRPPASTPPGATIAPTPAPLEAVKVPLYLARNPDMARQYAGDVACAGCHAGIFGRHHVSDHARSLTVVTPQNNPHFSPASRPLRDEPMGTTYRATVMNGRCAVVSKSPVGTQVMPATLALGSARNGQTYLSKTGEGAWYVLRLSYYTHIRQWDFTPQQEPQIAAFTDVEGQRIATRQVGDCLSCHSTVLAMAADGPDVSQSRFGVGCESCHGPGAEHIASMEGRRSVDGNTTVTMEDLTKATPSRILAICGGCHSTLTGAEPITADHPERAARFAATALEQSRCYVKSGKLSCITCHDPHTNVSHDPRKYEAACLTCHGGATAGEPAKTCSVNPRAGCIDCHMPSQEQPGFAHMFYHNHWIKVWKRASDRHTAGVPPIRT